MISEQECLATIFALNKFKIYLDHKRFRVVTDHCALCFLQTKRQLPQRLIRWSLILQEFDMEIVYKSGKHNADADCLSRYPAGPLEEIVDLEDRVHAFTATIDPQENLFFEVQMKDDFCQAIISNMN